MASSSVWSSPPAAKENMASSSDWPSLPAANKYKASSSHMAPKKEVVHTNWTDLPPELTSSILLRLGAIEILCNAQRVCRYWRRVCQDPSMWRQIDMYNRGNFKRMGYDLEIMCRHAVDRSQGGLTEIDLWYFGTNSLLRYIADRSSNLRSLSLVMCCEIRDEGFVESVVKLPQLEHLELTYCELSHESLKVVGQSCPNMKSLMLNCRACNWGWLSGWANDDEALAIAETMPRLRHLQLVGNKLSNTGLNAILDKCPNLEHLDLRKCSHVDLVGDLEKHSEKIRVVRRPSDFYNGYPLDVYFCDWDWYYYSPDADKERSEYYDHRSECDDYKYDQYDELYDFIVD